MQLIIEGGVSSVEEFTKKAHWFYDNSCCHPDTKQLVLLNGFDIIMQGRIINATDAKAEIARNIKHTIATVLGSGITEHPFFEITMNDDTDAGGFHMVYRLADEDRPCEVFSLVMLTPPSEVPTDKQIDVMYAAEVKDYAARAAKRRKLFFGKDFLEDRPKKSAKKSAKKDTKKSVKKDAKH